MKILYLDNNPTICASYLCDRHLIEQKEEVNKILSLAVTIRNAKINCRCHNTPEINWILHTGRDQTANMADLFSPVVQWCQHNPTHFIWTLGYLDIMIAESRLRFTQANSTIDTVEYHALLRNFRYALWPAELEGHVLMSPPPPPEADKYLGPDVIESYRNWYFYGLHGGKADIIKYTPPGKMPRWLRKMNKIL
jgi:hypothetical protein